MGKVLCQYKGEQQPQDIIEVDEEKAQLLLKRGDYIILEKMPEPQKAKELNVESAKRVEEFADDLVDDSKRNYSNRKNKKI